MIGNDINGCEYWFMVTNLKHLKGEKCNQWYIGVKSNKKINEDVCNRLRKDEKEGEKYDVCSW